MKWHVYHQHDDDRELVGSRKTLAGAQALAQRKAGRTIHGWFVRDSTGAEPTYETHSGVFRLEYGW